MSTASRKSNVTQTKKSKEVPNLHTTPDRSLFEEEEEYSRTKPPRNTEISKEMVVATCKPSHSIGRPATTSVTPLQPNADATDSAVYLVTVEIRVTQSINLYQILDEQLIGIQDFINIPE